MRKQQAFVSVTTPHFAGDSTPPSKHVKPRSIESAKAKAGNLSWLTHLRQRRVFPKSRNGGNTSRPVDCAAFVGSCRAQFSRVPRSAVHGPVLSRTSRHLERIERAEQARARRSHVTSPRLFPRLSRELRGSTASSSLLARETRARRIQLPLQSLRSFRTAT